MHQHHIPLTFGFKYPVKDLHEDSVDGVLLLCALGKMNVKKQLLVGIVCIVETCIDFST